MATNPKCPKVSPISEDDSSLVFPFTEAEYKREIATVNDVLVEQLENLGPLNSVEMSQHVTHWCYM